MTHQEINEIYEASVYQIRLRVAMALLPVSGINQERALEEADKFVELLMSESLEDLKKKYKW